jgi:hypothetical protein
MAKKRYTPEQIIGKLREAEVALAQGQTTGQVCRTLGIVEQTFYRWRREYNTVRPHSALSSGWAGRIYHEPINGKKRNFPTQNGPKRGQGQHVIRRSHLSGDPRKETGFDSKKTPGQLDCLTLHPGDSCYDRKT